MPNHKPKIDWSKARNEYIEDTTVTLAGIAKKYGVSKTIVERRASDEGWAEVRQKLGEKAFVAFQEKLLDTKEQAQNRHLTHYQNLQTIVNNQIIAFSEACYKRDKQGNIVVGKDNKPVLQVLDAKQLEHLTKAAKNAIDGERVVLGLPTNVQGVTDGKGDSMWSGFAEMIKEAEKVLAEDGSGESTKSSKTASSDS